MRVYLTFDVEIWCNDWLRLDDRFPAAFQRYVYGRSSRGDFALPKTLDILAKHGLQGVFFVEPLFAARFGLEYLETITALIRSGGQDTQLHLHTEWVNELPDPPIVDHSRKRQHLSFHTLEEQVALLSYGVDLLERVGSKRPYAFRAGSFACNADTFRALNHCGIRVDSSLNACANVSAPDLRAQVVHERPALIEGVLSVPVAIYVDGFGRPRSAQLNGSSTWELQQALESAHAAGHTDFVIVSHNFEMLKPGRCDPDPVVVSRFEGICRYLDSNRDAYRVCTFEGITQSDVEVHHRIRPKAGLIATGRRLAEQVWRRI
jgi:peptidoglycan/xylan/chitin deacetylase (PgdA/CDA1 family)